MSTKYTGFRASTAQQLTDEPGTSDALRRDRFLMLTASIKAPPAIASELAATGKSIASVDAAAVAPGDFKPPERAGSLAARRAAQRPPARRLMAGTAYSAEFPDFRAAATAMEEVDEGSLIDVFHATDEDGSGFIEAKELPELLRRLLGREATAHQLKAVMAAFDRNRDGRISEDELLEGWHQAVRMVCAEARAVVRRTAPKFKADKGPQVLGSGPMLSTSQADFGRYGEVPGARPAVDPTRGTMKGTTDDLAAGTAKTTRHPPGYMGFTSATKLRTAAASQSFGANARDTFSSKTNLLETMGGGLTGYTGHIPAGRSLSKPPGATDIGAADVLVAAYWAARARRREPGAV